MIDISDIEKQSILHSIYKQQLILIAKNHKYLQDIFLQHCFLENSQTYRYSNQIFRILIRLFIQIDLEEQQFFVCHCQCVDRHVARHV